MKLITYTFLIGITAISFNLHAQTSKYYHFPDSNTQWNVTISIRECCCAKYTYNLIHDTLINGEKYHQIWKRGYNYIPTSNGKCDFNVIGEKINKYSGAMREDTINRKVYFIPESKTIETLLYDFSAKAGDSIKTYQTYSFILIKNVDSVLINSKFRKRWTFAGSGLFDAEIIEGIGSNYGLLEILSRPIEGRSYLDCFSHSNKTVYPNLDENSGCPFILKSNVIIKENAIFRIQPNPSKGKFEILTSEKDYDIEVSNSLGEIILKASSINTIEIPNLTYGIYSLKFVSEKYLLTKKLIIN